MRLLEQSRRHAFLASRLEHPAISCWPVTQNRRLIEWDASSLRSDPRQDFHDFAARAMSNDVTDASRMADLIGDNVVTKRHDPWYEGLRCCNISEDVYIAGPTAKPRTDVRLQIQ